MAWVQDKRKELLDFMARLYYASPTGTIVRNLIDLLIKGRFEYYTSFDDLRAPATTINLPGQPADPSRDTDGSMLFSGSIENNIAVIMQLPHTWKLNSPVMPHVHWCKTVDSAGGVDWQMRYRIIRNNGSTTDWSEYVSAQSAFPELTGTDNNISRFPEIELSSANLSDLLSFQIRRLPSSPTDTYANNARLWEFDIHYEKDADGSFYEFKKDE